MNVEILEGYGECVGRMQLAKTLGRGLLRPLITDAIEIGRHVHRHVTRSLDFYAPTATPTVGRL